jgi:succinate dehydrogenase hydrophobic anchor subunit
MVTNVTNLSRSGLYDWMAQRVSAVVLAAYFIFLIGYVVAHPGIGYAQWHGLFANNGCVSSVCWPSLPWALTPGSACGPSRPTT